MAVYIASSSVPPTAGHVLIYKQDRDSSCLITIHLQQQKKSETQYGHLCERQINQEEVF